MNTPEQSTLFDPPAQRGKARYADPRTAKQAAKEVRAGTLQSAVLETIRAAGATGMTIEQISVSTKLSIVSVSPRMKPLRLKGLIRDSGKRRRNSSGYDAIVWERVP